MIICKLIVALATPILIGTGCLLYLFRKRPLPFYIFLSLAYGLGLSILSYFMFFLGSWGIPLNTMTIGCPLWILSLLLIGTYLKSYPLPQKIAGTTSPSLYKQIITYIHSLSLNKLILLCLLLAFIIYNIYYVFWFSLRIPVSTWDAYATVAFKGKILFYERSFSNIKNFPLASYPLHTPLIISWVAMCLGSWHDQLIKIFFPFTFTFFIFIYYFFLRQYASRLWALFGTTLLLSSSFLVEQARFCTRDFAILYYNCSAILLLFLWHKTKHKGFLFLAALFSAFTTFTKLEGSAYPAIHIVLLIVLLAHDKSRLREKVLNFLKFTAPCISISLIYPLYKILNNFASSEKFNAAFGWENFSRIPVIINRIANNLFLSWDWNIVWAFFVATLIAHHKKISRLEVKFFSLSILLFLGLWFTVFFFSPIYYAIESNQVAIFGDIPRFIMHFFPMVPVVIVLVIKGDE